jgi:molecular chaperone IbpA
MEDMFMRQFDFAPLYRSTVGFDRLAQLMDSAGGVDADG